MSDEDQESTLEEYVLEPPVLVKHKPMFVYINGIGRKIASPMLSYADILHLLDYAPEKVLSVTFSKAVGRTDGILTRGQSVEVQEGTIINAYDTSYA